MNRECEVLSKIKFKKMLDFFLVLYFDCCATQLFEYNRLYLKGKKLKQPEIRQSKKRYSI